jgi:hypothetical protein
MGWNVDVVFPAVVLIVLGIYHVVTGTCLKGGDDEDDSTGTSNHDSRYSNGDF